MSDSLHHFAALRRRISPQLAHSRSAYARHQIRDHPWLYGALGAVPADVMFICENPSVRGVRQAHQQPVGGRKPDLESQWWGGPRDYAARRFRRVLCELGLKTTPPGARGGWKCYITNLVKEANVVRDQNALSSGYKKRQAEAWAPTLTWELVRVRPRYIFCVGAKTARLMRWLQQEKLLPHFDFHQIWHYSSRGSDAMVRRRMLQRIRQAMRRPPAVDLARFR